MDNTIICLYVPFGYPLSIDSNEALQQENLCDYVIFGFKPGARGFLPSPLKSLGDNISPQNPLKSAPAVFLNCGKLTIFLVLVLCTLLTIYKATKTLFVDFCNIPLLFKKSYWEEL